MKNLLLLISSSVSEKENEQEQKKKDCFSSVPFLSSGFPFPPPFLNRKIARKGVRKLRKQRETKKEAMPFFPLFQLSFSVPNKKEKWE